MGFQYYGDYFLSDIILKICIQAWLTSFFFFFFSSPHLIASLETTQQLNFASYTAFPKHRPFLEEAEQKDDSFLREKNTQTMNQLLSFQLLI